MNLCLKEYVKHKHRIPFLNKALTDGRGVSLPQCRWWNLVVLLSVRTYKWATDTENLGGLKYRLRLLIVLGPQLSETQEYMHSFFFVGGGETCVSPVAQTPPGWWAFVYGKNRGCEALTGLGIRGNMARWKIPDAKPGRACLTSAHPGGRVTLSKSLCSLVWAGVGGKKWKKFHS